MEALEGGLLGRELAAVAGDLVEPGVHRPDQAGGAHDPADVGQDAFLGLYRNWNRLHDPANALPYLRSSVLNGCRAALCAQARGDHRNRTVADRDGRPPFDPTEAAVLLSEEHQEVLAAVRRLADRQREALMLRYYLGFSTDETARVMGVSPGTVKSALSRAIAALGHTLKEDS